MKSLLQLRACYCLLFLFLFQSAFSQKKILLNINQATGKASIEIQKKGTTTKTISIEKDEVFVPTGEVTIQIKNTNTLFYQYTLNKEAAKAKDYEAIRSFLAALKPYATDLLTTGIQIQGTDESISFFMNKLLLPSEAQKKLDPKEKRWKDIFTEALKNIDQQTIGQKGIQNTYLTCINQLSPIATQAKKGVLGFKQIIGERFDKNSPMRLKAINNLEIAYHTLDKKLRNFDEEMGGEIPEELSSIKKQVLKALSEAPSILNAAYTVEAFARTILGTQEEKNFKTFKLKPSKAQSLTIDIKPKTTPSLARYAKHKPYQLKVVLQPRTWIKPTVGLSLLHSPTSVFPKYTTQAVDSKFKIIASGQQDSRFTWGFNLGANFPLVPKGNWLDLGPELTVNPGDAIRAIGLGTGITIKNLIRLSVGSLWTKHLVLDDQKVGQELSLATDLKTKETYASPKLYFGISIIGWPPFVAQ